jgi:hypothetical protein
MVGRGQPGTARGDGRGFLARAFLPERRARDTRGGHDGVPTLAAARSTVVESVTEYREDFVTFGDFYAYSDKNSSRLENSSQ